MPDTATGQALALRPPQPDHTPEVWQMVQQQAALLYRSELVNKDQVKSVDDAILIVLKGRELGIPPTQALQNIIVIKGKVTCNAELMLALIYRDMGSSAFIWTTPAGQDDKLASCQYRRPGWSEYRRYTFSMEDAERAGLGKRSTYKPNDPTMWEKFPANMLRARCITNVAKLAFPDVVAGMATYEEMGGNVTVNEQGEVVPADAAGQVIDVTPAASDQAPTTVEDAKARLLGRLADAGRAVPGLGCGTDPAGRARSWQQWVDFSLDLHVPPPPSPQEVGVAWLVALDTALVRFLEVEAARKLVAEYDALDGTTTATPTTATSTVTAEPSAAAPTPTTQDGVDMGTDRESEPLVLEGDLVDADMDAEPATETETESDEDADRRGRQEEQAMVFDELIDDRPHNAAWVKKVRDELSRSLTAGDLREEDYGKLVRKLERRAAKIAS